MKKKFTLYILFMFSLSAYGASEYSYKNYNAYIHTATLSIPSETIDALLSTSVGYFQNGICIYQRETEKHPYKLVDGAVVSLKGDILKQLVGTQYECAATNYDYNAKRVRDEFKLIKKIIKGEEEYVDTEPPTSTVNLD